MPAVAKKKRRPLIKRSRLFKSLVENGIDFLKKSLADIKKSPKYSVINFCAAVELFLKARLIREHWSLILTKPESADLAKFKAGDFVSDSMEEAIRRLDKICNEKIGHEVREAFKATRNHRNNLVHFFHRGYAKASGDKKGVRRLFLPPLAQVTTYPEQLVKHWRLKMEPNESTHGRTGETIFFSGDYTAACCAVVKQLTSGQSYPNCSEHGETRWSSIPPFVQSDWDTAALIAHWKHLQSQRSHAVLSQSVGLGASVHVISPGGIPSEEAFGTPKVHMYPGLLLQAAIIVPGDKTTEGHIIEAVGPAWSEILKQLERDPDFLYRFSEYDREFEELIAGAYKRDGWPEVVLTPRRGDKGRDIIASKPGFGSIRFVDQVKAYAPNHRVTMTCEHWSEYLHWNQMSRRESLPQRPSSPLELRRTRTSNG